MNTHTATKVLRSGGFAGLMAWPNGRWSKTLPSTPATTSTPGPITWVGWQAQLRLEQGRLHEAELIARAVLRLERLTLVMRLPALAVLGRVRMRRGEADALPLPHQALREARATGEPQRIVPALLALAEAAGETLARAVQLLEAMDARAQARDLGVTGQLPKIRRGPYQAARQHPLGLTGRELQVLRLLAEGLGNLDIAQRLSRSPRTVEHHVSAVLGKLGAASRVGVLVRLRSEPWLLEADDASAPIEN